MHTLSMVRNSGRLAHTTATRITVLAVVLAFGLGVSPAARADVEPNAHIRDAEGPLLSPGPWSGSVGGADARDMYVLYVSGPAQLQLSFSLTAGECVDAPLQNDDNTDRVQAYAAAGQTGQATIAAPAGRSRWFIVVQGYDGYRCNGAGDYQFTVSADGGQLVSGPAFSPAQSISALATTADQAFGPLQAGTTYQGTIAS